MPFQDGDVHEGVATLQLRSDPEGARPREVTPTHGKGLAGTVPAKK
jgi:hypothetical protein